MQTAEGLKHRIARFESFYGKTEKDEVGLLEKITELYAKIGKDKAKIITKLIVACCFSAVLITTNNF
jgi:hypothetical protein